MSGDQSIFDIVQKSFSLSGKQLKYSPRPGQIKCKGAGKELSLRKDTRSRGFQSILKGFSKEGCPNISNQLNRLGGF